MKRFISLLACVAVFALAVPAIAGSPGWNKEGAATDSGKGESGKGMKGGGGGAGQMKDGKGEAGFQACQADMDKYCKDVRPGDGRLMGCMQGNVDRLSPDCANVVRGKGAHEQKMREMHQKKAAETEKK